jgi:hypothetical protein
MPPRRRTRPAADPATRARAGASSLRHPALAARRPRVGHLWSCWSGGSHGRRGRDGESSLATSGGESGPLSQWGQDCDPRVVGWRPGRQVRLGRGLDRPGPRIAEETVPDPGTCAAHLARRGAVQAAPCYGPAAIGAENAAQAVRTQLSAGRGRPRPRRMVLTSTSTSTAASAARCRPANDRNQVREAD